MGDSGEPITKDAGYLLSEDPVAIDKAAYEVIIKNAGEDIFLKHNKKSGMEHLQAAEKFGMGTNTYRLKQI